MKFSLVCRRPGRQGVQAPVDSQSLSRQSTSKAKNRRIGFPLVEAVVARRARKGVHTLRVRISPGTAKVKVKNKKERAINGYAAANLGTGFGVKQIDTVCTAGHNTPVDGC